MKKEDFEKASPIMDIIKNIEGLLNSFDLGSNSDDKEFSKDDFFNGIFFEVKNMRLGDQKDCSRTIICKYSDGSGEKYSLTKQEIIGLQNYIKSMLEKRKDESLKQLEEI